MAKQGDAEAFDSLARMSGDRCLANAVRILRDIDLAEDAVQAALITAWTDLRALRDPSRFEPWLHRILTNACYAEARRRRRWSEGLRILPVEGAYGPDEYLTVDDRDLLERAFRRLTVQQRAVVVPPLPRAIDLRGGGTNRTSRRDCEVPLAKTAEDVDGLRVLTLGPMTNLADALARDPALAGRLESVYAMGGAPFVPGNVRFGGPPDNAVPEWNIYVDPTAAQTVVDSGIAVRLVSLDGTNQVPVTPEWAERVQRDATGPGARVLAELLAGHPYMTDGTYFLWDPLAAALAAGHPIGSFSAARVDVEEDDGHEAGFTRPVDGAANVEYLRTADRAAAEEVLLATLN